MNILNLQDKADFEEGFDFRFTGSVDLRVIKRTNIRTMTLISGLCHDLDLKKLCRGFKHEFKCIGSVKENIIKLSGDHREKVRDFLLEEGICQKKQIIIHGY